MRTYLGGSALSSFRLRKIEERWAPIEVRLAEARFLYLIEKEGPGGDPEERLRSLLGDAQAVSATLPDADCDLIIVPRLGTVSPWSSKATDILERIGLGGFGRIERGVVYRTRDPLTETERALVARHITDPLTESVLPTLADARQVFESPPPRSLGVIPLLTGGPQALEQADRQLGLGLDGRDRAHLLTVFRRLGRDPTDAELMMWAQIHSEHCRHHIFNSPLETDGQRLERTLFDSIRETYRSHHGPVLLAYRDNAAVIEGDSTQRIGASLADRVYRMHREPVHGVIKVETHNHPTAIAPFPGAATGSGGEIRDEAATGRGARPRAGLCGFSVSDLHIPGLARPWEKKAPTALPGMASAFEIMRDGPIGAASYNNEFGRPNLAGYFRSFESEAGADPASRVTHGYAKPVMLAGGIGSLRGQAWRKRPLRPGLAIVVLGGPGFLIGLGGGTQSSRTGGLADGLDWASVQRGNPEMERRTQEVIDRLVALGPENPVVAIHDVGAGGLANAVPELAWSGRVGARIDLQSIPRGDSSLSPMELWCNESQERYVLALRPEGLTMLGGIAARERCPWARIGETTAEPRLVVRDGTQPETPIDLDLDLLFQGTRRRRRRIVVPQPCRETSDGLVWTLSTVELLREVLKAPTVADKSFLVTIADRTVGGLSVRDPMVGPYQVPVADVAVVARDFDGFGGDAFALGERPPVALIDPRASARLALAEALTNLMASPVPGVHAVALSANWMAAAGDAGEEGALYAAVEALSDCARALSIPIPVGKDSLSMRVRLPEGPKTEIRAPVTVVISAFGRVTDVRRTLTPAFDPGKKPVLLLVELSHRKGRLGGSVAAQVMGQLGAAVPDLDDPEALPRFWHLLDALRERGWVCAYHDRSDGGAWVAALEMAFASRAGLEFRARLEGESLNRFLLDEAPGAIVAVDSDRAGEARALLEEGGFAGQVHRLAETSMEDRIRIRSDSRVLFEASRSELRRTWSQTTHAIKHLRDEPASADQEELARDDPDRYRLWASPAPARKAFRASRSSRPRVAILREQGVNGQLEMAAAFMAAGFRASDVHMSDLVSGDETLESYDVVAACGGFSYGDVLGAGNGWAQAVRDDPRLRDGFRAFFARTGTLALGICNGCQMLAGLRDLIPGAEDWPEFRPNRSEQFEARLVMVRVGTGPSPWLSGLAGGEWPIVVSHGEGRAWFAPGDLDRLRARGGVALEYLSGRGEPTEDYPANPNGSPGGVTAFTNRDGRVLIAMPHFERSFRTIQLSWHPDDWRETSPWLALFDNARRFVLSGRHGSGTQNGGGRMTPETQTPF